MNRHTKAFGVVLVFVPLMLIKTKPITKDDDRVWQQYLKAEAPILVPGSGTAEAEKFAADLRAIDLTGAPSDVQKAMSSYIAAVETNLVVRRAGGNVATANEQVVEAKRSSPRQ